MPALEDALRGVLASPDLTVMAQAIGLDEVDPAGNLAFPQFFPFADANGIDLASLTAIDYRPVATRREWNAHGKEIPLRTPELMELTMVPIESRNGIGEAELHRINTTVSGNAGLFAEQIMARIPARIGMLVEANFRRAEIDAMAAWANGAIVAANPTSGATQTTSLGFDGARVATAGTAWTLANAYSNFVAWYVDAQAAVGGLAGAMMSRAQFNAIRTNAPNPMNASATAVIQGMGSLEARIQDEVGGAFRFVINESQADVFNDGGSAVTRTRVWPESVIAAIPAGGTVGNTFRAPVVKAYDFLTNHPTIDVRGMVVTNNDENKGKYADIQCQANWVSLPAEGNVFTLNTGVTEATT